MFCTSCGVENENSVRFCYSCGSATHVPTTQAAASGFPGVPTLEGRSVATAPTRPNEARDLGPSNSAPAASGGRVTPLSTTALPRARVYVRHVSGTLGPWTIGELREALAEGRVSRTSLGRHEGSTEPKTVSELLDSLSALTRPGRQKRFLGNTQMNVGLILEVIGLLLLLTGRTIPFLVFLVAGALLYRAGKRRLDGKPVVVPTALEPAGDPLTSTSTSAATASKDALRP